MCWLPSSTKARCACQFVKSRRVFSSCVFVLGASFVGQVSPQLYCRSSCQRRQGVRVSCRNHEECSELVFVSGASFA